MSKRRFKAEILERLGMYDRRNLKMDSPVFDDADEWIDTQEVW